MALHICFGPATEEIRREPDGERCRFDFVYGEEAPGE